MCVCVCVCVCVGAAPRGGGGGGGHHKLRQRGLTLRWLGKCNGPGWLQPNVRRADGGYGRQDGGRWGQAAALPQSKELAA